MEYDYTGSNSFFGADGKPTSIADAEAAYQSGLAMSSPVESAQDVRAYMRYRF
jgi:hypothetical protein